MAPEHHELVELIRSRIETMRPADRNKVLDQTLMLLSQRTGPAAADDGRLSKERSERGLVVSDWAEDHGVHNDRQRLELPMRPLDVQVKKTRKATGQALVSNGFLGADLLHVPAGEGFAPHTHPGDHLLIVVGGHGTISTRGEIVETKPGQVYMIDGAQPHAVGAITDHLILAVGASHRDIDSNDRQTLVPFEKLLGADGRISCGVCGIDADGDAELTGEGCKHSPARFVM